MLNLARFLVTYKNSFISMQANRTFSDIEKLEHLAEDWLDTSQKIRSVLQQNDSQYYLGLVLNSEDKCLRRHNNMAHNLTGYKPSDYFGYFFLCSPRLTYSVRRRFFCNRTSYVRARN